MIESSERVCDRARLGTASRTAMVTHFTQDLSGLQLPFGVSVDLPEEDCAALEEEPPTSIYRDNLFLRWKKLMSLLHFIGRKKTR